jgi:hypothetical protein
MTDINALLERLAVVERAIDPPSDETRRSDKKRLTSGALAARYGVVVRTIDRWAEDPKLNFPKPIIVNRRRYWSAAELDQWDRSRVRGTIQKASVRGTSAA